MRSDAAKNGIGATLEAIKVAAEAWVARLSYCLRTPGGWRSPRPSPIDPDEQADAEKGQHQQDEVDLRQLPVHTRSVYGPPQRRVPRKANLRQMRGANERSQVPQFGTVWQFRHFSGRSRSSTASGGRRRMRGCADVHLAQSPRGSPTQARVLRTPAPRRRTGMDSCLQLLRGR